MDKSRIKSALRLLFTAFIGLAVYLGVGGYAWEKFFLDEHTYKADLNLIAHTDIADTYDLVIDEKDKITSWEKHTFRDSMTYYVLYIKAYDTDKFFADNNELISHMEIVNSMKVGRREFVVPYLFYENKKVAIVTTDIRGNKFEKDDARQVYSDTVAQSFDEYISEEIL